jgi:hypothetical protein
MMIPPFLAFKIRHYLICKQFDPVPRPLRVSRAGVKIKGDLVNAEFVTQFSQAAATLGRCTDYRAFL